VGGEWRPIPKGSKVRLVASGGITLTSKDGTVAYFDGGSFRIVRVPKETNDNG